MKSTTGVPIVGEPEVSTGNFSLPLLSRTVDFFFSLPTIVEPWIEVPFPNDWIYSGECREELEEAEEDVRLGRVAGFANVEDLLQELKS